MARGRRERGKPYRLVAEELPPVERGVRVSEYDDLLDTFVESDVKTARVEYPDKPMKALMVALRARVRRRDLKVRVVQRKGSLYLTKE